MAELLYLPGESLCATLMLMDHEGLIETNLAQVRERIANAARRSGRSPDAVTLVAVTKTQPAFVVAAANRLGVNDFGENRVEEAINKIPEVQAHIGGSRRPRWHMIGHVQRRKAQLAVGLFDYIHSVDSLRLAKRISRFAVESAKTVSLLLEVNVSGEASKYGFDCSPVAGQEVRSRFFEEVEQILALPNLWPQGLMTMAPIVSNPELARPVFVALRELRDQSAQRFPEADWRALSMGMTDDFEVAIEEGATIVRIGRAIFGERRTT